jgi:hypothetical protein
MSSLPIDIGAGILDDAGADVVVDVSVDIVDVGADVLIDVGIDIVDVDANVIVNVANNVDDVCNLYCCHQMSTWKCWWCLVIEMLTLICSWQW